MKVKSTNDKCDICDTGFTQISHINLHNPSVHDKKKPLKCDICDKCWKFSKNKHMGSVIKKDQSNVNYVPRALIQRKT